MSDQTELQKLIEEFDAARSLEAAAIKTIDSMQGKDPDVLVRVTQDMLKAHNKSMEVYFKLLKHKLKNSRASR